MFQKCSKLYNFVAICETLSGNSFAGSSKPKNDTTCINEFNNDFRRTHIRNSSTVFKFIDKATETPATCKGLSFRYLTKNF